MRQQCAKLMTDQAVLDRCGGGSFKNVWKDVEDCMPLTKEGRMRGVVVVEFERSELFLGKSRFMAEMSKYTHGTWLKWSSNVAGKEASRAIENGAYLIEFEGRRSTCSKPAGQVNGYGHMLAYRDLAIVDRLISWEQVTHLPDPFGEKR